MTQVTDQMELDYVYKYLAHEHPHIEVDSIVSVTMEYKADGDEQHGEHYYCVTYTQSVSDWCNEWKSFRARVSDVDGYWFEKGGY